MNEMEREIQEIKQFLARYDQQRLLEAKKLVLLVDLDNTLVHTLVKEVGGASSRVPDAAFEYQYQIDEADPSSPLLLTRIRPHAIDFLKNLSPMFEMRICTLGCRQYARKIANLLDRQGLYFADRITAREDTVNCKSKTEHVTNLFPCGDQLVLIVDDREDVWNSAPNLIPIRPFNGIDDDYLVQLETLLRRVHRDYFVAYSNPNSLNQDLLHVKSILFNICNKVGVQSGAVQSGMRLKRRKSMPIEMFDAKRRNFQFVPV